MKKLSLFLVFVALSFSSVSCTIEDFHEEIKVKPTTRDSGGQSGDIKPPPPPCTTC